MAIIYLDPLSKPPALAKFIDGWLILAPCQTESKLREASYEFYRGRQMPPGNLHAILSEIEHGQLDKKA